MGLHPSSAAVSQDCILCLACTKVCPQNAVRLDVRVPWSALLEPVRWDALRSFLSVVLVAMVAAVSVPAWLERRGLLRSSHVLVDAVGAPLASLILFGVVGGGFLALVYLASAWAGRRRGTARFVALGYAYLPLGLAGFFNVYFGEFVERGSDLMPRLLHALNLGGRIPAEWVTPNLATLQALPPLITLLGTGFSLYFLRQIARAASMPRAVTRVHALLLLLVAAVFLVCA
jgi:ferredoxin